MAKKLENDCLRASNSFICNSILHAAANVVLLESSFGLVSFSTQSSPAASYLNQNKIQWLPAPTNRSRPCFTHHLPNLPVASYRATPSLRPSLSCGGLYSYLPSKLWYQTLPLLSPLVGMFLPQRAVWFIPSFHSNLYSDDFQQGQAWPHYLK